MNHSFMPHINIHSHVYKIGTKVSNKIRFKKKTLIEKHTPTKIIGSKANIRLSDWMSFLPIQGWTKNRI